MTLVLGGLTFKNRGQWDPSIKSQCNPNDSHRFFVVFPKLLLDPLQQLMILFKKDRIRIGVSSSMCFSRYNKHRTSRAMRIPRLGLSLGVDFFKSAGLDGLKKFTDFLEVKIG